MDFAGHGPKLPAGNGRRPRHTLSAVTVEERPDGAALQPFRSS